MLTMDISNLWNGVSLPELLAWEPQLLEAQRRLLSGLDDDFADWMWTSVPPDTLARLRAAARRIRQTSDTLVVIGRDEALLGIQGVLELLRGRRHNDNPTKPRIYFTGSSLSSRDFLELQNILEDRDFSVCFITYAGTTVESALSYRALKWKLTAKYGEAGARERIYAVTEEEESRLFHRMEEQGITVFDTPRRVCGRFSVLSAVGLLPLLVAGIDPAELVAGAAELQPQLRLASFENPAWLYCAGRRLLWERGRSVELLMACESRMESFCRFWQHLFADYPGPLSLSALYSRDARLADGRRDVFETYLRAEPPEDRVMVESAWDDTDSMSFLEGSSLADVEAAALDGVMEDHLDRGIPAFLLDCGHLNPRLGGGLVHFLEFSAALWTAFTGEDPFQPRPVSDSRRRMLSRLGAPQSC